MYNVSRGPSRIINRTRRDLSQKLESLDQVRELTRKNSVTEDAEHTTMSSPRPVFQSVGGGNKGGRSTNGRAQPHDTITPQHEELIRFFNDWNGIAYYQEKTEHPALQDFKPFDLEAWWGKRIYQNLTQST
ncbi:MAPK regulated corepressor interacting protein 2-like isoform X3 [Homarus americanus]|uniref:MAPK regulated corepressor interacting protein 2-like isoform X3 n=1 Tax=Homarus americanus TaxID=6706 RepID=UPI001C455A85|nr:MAPK regulated corepressor interacting protein 2-like isoform X3 [Homarus americanus]